MATLPSSDGRYVDPADQAARDVERLKMLRAEYDDESLDEGTRAAVGREIKRAGADPGAMRKSIQVAVADTAAPAAAAQPLPAHSASNPYAHLFDDGARIAQPAATPDRPYAHLFEDNAKPNLLLGVSANPDQEAEKQRLAKRYNLPPDVVEAFHADYTDKAKFDDANAKMARAPALRSWIAEDGQRAKIAHDDIANLSAIEQVLKTGKAYSGAAAEGLVGQAAGGTLSGAGEVYDIATRGIAKLLPQGVEEALRGVSIPDWLDPSKLLLKGPGQALKDIGKAAGPEGADRTFGTDVAAGIGQVGGQIAAALMTGGAASGGMLFAQGADAMAEKVAVDQAGQAEKDVATLLGASWTGITEKYGLDKLLNRVPPQVKSAVFRRIADIAAGAGIEAAQEFAENIGQDVIQKLLTAPDTQIGGDALQSASVGGAVGGLVRAVLGVRGHGAQAQRAQEDAKALEQINKLAEASKVRERSAEDWQSFMQTATEQGAVKDVYLDARDLDAAALRELVAVSPSAAQQAAESLASGVDMQIPAAEFGTNVAGQSFAQGVIPHLKTDPNGMSATQAEEYLKTHTDAMRETVTQTLDKVSAEDAVAQSRAAVEQHFLAQLNTVGRGTEAVNKPQAALLAARYAALGQQLGITPEEALQRLPVDIAGATPTGDMLTQAVQNNASGESAASLEAQSRLQQEKDRGQVRLLVDRNGTVRPLPGVDAVDTHAKAGQVVLQRGVGSNEWTVLSQGADVKGSAVARAKANAAAHVKAAGSFSQTERPSPEAVEMRKRESVLKSLLECLA